MPYPFTPADVRWLTSSAGREALTAAADLPLTDETLLADVSRLRRLGSSQGSSEGSGLFSAPGWLVGSRLGSSEGWFVGAAVETVRLRRRAEGKLGPRAAGWLFTDEALQQASPAVVAAHRAARLAGFGVHDLTCSIGADLAALAAACPVAVGSDVDEVRLAMARHNLAAVGLAPLLVRADATTRTTHGLVLYADPARRTNAGRRITSVDTLPSVAALDEAHAARPPVLRLPPGIDYDALARPGEVEIVSLDGGAREAVLWPAEFATVRRRATVLRTPVRSGPPAVEEVTTDDPDDAGLGPAQEWIVDPDPAVVRAHLVRHYAARHGLALLDPQLAYLTGPRPPRHTRAFRVLDEAPFTERVVAGWARRDRVGTLEIKQRGTPVVPDELRRRLRPALTGPSTRDATLIVARIGQEARAFWCAAVDGRTGDAGAAIS